MNGYVWGPIILTPLLALIVQMWRAAQRPVMALPMSGFLMTRPGLIAYVLFASQVQFPRPLWIHVLVSALCVVTWWMQLALLEAYIIRRRVMAQRQSVMDRRVMHAQPLLVNAMVIMLVVAVALMLIGSTSWV